MKPSPSDPLGVGGWMDELEATGQLPPLLAACRVTPQQPNHHSEGTVYRHTRLAVGELGGAAARVGVAPTLDQALAVVCHDLGKPTCWDPGTGHYYGHEIVGADLVPGFLGQMDPEGRVGRDRVAWCVRHHLFWLHADLTRVRDAPIARRYCRPDGWGDDLRVLNLCDGLASWGPDGRPHTAYLEACQDRIEETRRRLAENESRPSPVLTGHDVMAALGIPPGRQVGEWLGRLAQSGIDDPEEARRWLRQASAG